MARGGEAQSHRYNINERAGERCCCQARRSGSRRRERSGGSNGRDSGRVRIATVGRSRSNGWDRSPGKLAVVAATASGIRLRAGK